MVAIAAVLAVVAGLLAIRLYRASPQSAPRDDVAVNTFQTAVHQAAVQARG
jgi:hypothetical protein